MPKSFNETIVGDNRDRLTIDIFRIAGIEHYIFNSSIDAMRGIAKIHGLDRVPTAAYVGAERGIWVCYDANYKDNSAVFIRVV